MNIQDKIEVKQLISEACAQLNYGKTVFDAPEAIELLLGTWAIESNGGKYLRQLGNGPALSAWQIEPLTFRDTIIRCWPNQRYILNLNAGVEHISITDFPKIEFNHKLACQVARLKYFLCPGAIPLNMTGQAQYYKKYYNTPLGKATVEKYIEKYQRYAF
jgi:hypothetical protein